MASPRDYFFYEDAKGFRSYDFPTEPIPRLNYVDPEVQSLVCNNKPVIIEGSHLIETALKWDLDYLENHIGDLDFTVFSSDNHNFKYYSTNKSKFFNEIFEPPTTRLDMTFKEFADKLRNWQPGNKRLYLQQPLNISVTKTIVEDFRNFHWDWIKALSKKCDWDSLTSNLLLIATEGNVTPCHYDEQQNFFAQAIGKKRCILFPPDQIDCLYPYPVFHPHDRQSQVDFDKPDYSRYPRFKEVKGRVAILEPGDVLYIPMYWWHHVESMMDNGYTVSVNFWFKAGPNSDLIYPLKDHQKLAILRNTEKMLLEALQSSEELGVLLRAMVLGRYT